ncbi:MAG: hypothetical protein Q8Q17_03490 [bacterium]|nr:hypothetical protein [bacterium]
MKTVKVFSLTDWKYHRGKVNWDDLFSDEGLLVATVVTMKLAKEDGLFSEKWFGKLPSRIIAHDSDGAYSIYENVPILTRQIIQRILDDFGNLRQRKFVFIYGKLPRKLPKLYKNLIKRAKGYKDAQKIQEKTA